MAKKPIQPRGPAKLKPVPPFNPDSVPDKFLTDSQLVERRKKARAALEENWPTELQSSQHLYQGQKKKGGKIKKTGIYKLHKGERVLNVKQVKRFDKARKEHFGL